MVHEVKGKVIAVTGGATGIGAIFVRKFLAEGAKHVAALDIAVDAGKALEQELNQKNGPGKVKFIKCDVTVEKDFDNAFQTIIKEHGYIDVLVNNAGIMNDSIYRKEIEVNVIGLVIGCHKINNLMRKDKGGKGGTIINIASIAGILKSEPLPVYMATKTAVIEFGRCLGMDKNYNRTGVRVVTICFGGTLTPLLVNSGPFDEANADLDKEILDSLRKQTPEQAVEGVIVAYKKGDKGHTVWLVDGGDPAVDFTDDIEEGFDVMSKKLLAKAVAALDIANSGKELEQDLNKKYGASKMKFIKCDVTVEKDFDDAFKTIVSEFGYIDVLVNNAGIMNDKMYRREIEVNVTGLVTGSYKAYNLMRKDKSGKGGTIINISSIAGIYKNTAVPVYLATKTAIIQFGRCLGDDETYNRTGVRVITICFGNTKTAIFDNPSPFDEVYSDFEKPILETVPMQTPEQASDGAFEAFQNGEKGNSVWLIDSGNQAVDITEDIEEGFGVMCRKLKRNLINK